VRSLAYLLPNLAAPDTFRQVIVGTLGKLKSWSSKRQLQFKEMRIMVFDEADEMLKADGFADDSMRMIRDIQKQSPDCQVTATARHRASP